LCSIFLRPFLPIPIESTHSPLGAQTWSSRRAFPGGCKSLVDCRPHNRPPKRSALILSFQAKQPSTPEPVRSELSRTSPLSTFRRSQKEARTAPLVCNPQEAGAYSFSPLPTIIVSLPLLSKRGHPYVVVSFRKPRQPAPQSPTPHVAHRVTSAPFVHLKGPCLLLHRFQGGEPLFIPSAPRLQVAMHGQSMCLPQAGLFYPRPNPEFPWKFPELQSSLLSRE